MEIEGKVEWVSGWKYDWKEECEGVSCDVYYIGLDNGLKVKVLGKQRKTVKPWVGDVVRITTTHRKYQGWVKVNVYEKGNSLEIIKENVEAREEWRKKTGSEREEYYKIMKRINEIDEEINNLPVMMMKKYLGPVEKDKTLYIMFNVMNDLKFGSIERGRPGKTSVQLTGYFERTHVPPTGLCRYSLNDMVDNYRNYILRKMKEYGLIELQGDVSNPKTIVSLTQKGKSVLYKINKEYAEKLAVLKAEKDKLENMMVRNSYYQYLNRRW